MTTAPIQAVSALVAGQGGSVAQMPAPVRGGFSNLIGGVEAANRQVLQAQSQAAAFSLDDSVPIHQVTYALENARLSMELMLQVRTKLTDGFQELMRMQL